MLSVRASLLALVSISLPACAQNAPRASLTTTTGLSPAATTVSAGTQPSPLMLRNPDVGPTHIVFVYADDLWIVPREGGVALPLASPAGLEQFPKFSADGGTIAFVGNYEGNRDLYTIPTNGGVPIRVTYHPAQETLCDWAPDGRLVYFTNGFAGLGRQVQLYTVAAAGGLPEKLLPPYGANGAISSDGKWLAYTPHTRDHRTWKRYRGGMATDIWLLNLRDHSSKRITDWEGTDSQPMWHGQTIYYMSDAGPLHRMNIWSYDVDSGVREQVTHFADFDVKWPSIGPGSNGAGEIVLQNGSGLYLIDLADGQAREVQVHVPGDRPTIRPHDVNAAKFISSLNISSTGKRAVIAARGDIWTLPAKHGSPRNLTRTDGVVERDPTWSPDGQWLAYFSDQTGEYELYIMQSDGKGETRQLTSDGNLFRYNPVWSPDSKHIAFSDMSGSFYLHTLEGGTTRLIDVDPWAGRPTLSWASDSGWIAYNKGGANRSGAIWLYKVGSGEKHQVTSGMFSDTWPTFDRKGDYLFFSSHRDFSSPVYEDIGTTFVYSDTDVLVVVPLRDDVGSPWAPKSDEEKWGDDEKEGEDDAEEQDDDNGDTKGDASTDKGDDEDSETKDEKKSEDDGNGKDDEKEPGPVEIEIEGFEQRALKIPVKRGAFHRLAVSHDGKLIYVRSARRGSDGKSAIKIFDLEDEKKEEKTVLEAGFFTLSADGKKMLVRNGKTMAIVDAKADQKLDKPISQEGMNDRIDPRAEWRQMFNEAWRVERDFFYDPNMHGVDWNAVRTRYGAMIDDCVSRRDVQFVIGEMISELNVGHAYVRGGGDVEEEPKVSVGMLGVDYSLDNGAYRISKIYEGAAWDIDARGPLTQPNVDVHEGDYLLEVNGVPVDSKHDPWAVFQGLAKTTVTLTVSEKSIKDDDARQVIVEPIENERNLRYRAWIERNRKHVEAQSNGRVGYVYVPNTGRNGQNDLVRQFYGQLDKDALIVDERWNGGGQIPTRFIELLNRSNTNYWARRHGNDWPWPPDSHQGPKCMLINGLAGSGGDCFPYYFRQAGIGKLIGMRTWGGLVGISGNPGLIDGGGVTAPTFAFYENDGTWGVEGHGVDPDIEVIDDPALMIDGGDPQLDKAIEHMLAELRRNPYMAPKRPTYPDRSGMGVSDADK